MKKCSCGREIASNRATRCPICQEKYRKKYWKEVNAKIPKSSRATKETYALWKLCKTLSSNEKKVLLAKYEQELTYSKNKREIKRYLKIINDSRHTEYLEDTEEYFNMLYAESFTETCEIRAKFDLTEKSEPGDTYCGTKNHDNEEELFYDNEFEVFKKKTPKERSRKDIYKEWSY
jgi:pyocin large subunit-like protein